MSEEERIAAIEKLAVRDGRWLLDRYGRVPRMYDVEQWEIAVREVALREYGHKYQALTNDELTALLLSGND